jgi:transcriptional regulator
MATQSEVFVPSGASIYEATAQILQRADLLGVKLVSSSYDILAAIRCKCKGKIRGHHLISAVKVEIRSDGLLHFEPRT